ncbi:hypothetical protein PMAYCL1PPCAC_14066, partial [Pristionchus mayeri]
WQCSTKAHSSYSLLIRTVSSLPKALHVLLRVLYREGKSCTFKTNLLERPLPVNHNQCEMAVTGNGPYEVELKVHGGEQSATKNE